MDLELKYNEHPSSPLRNRKRSANEASSAEETIVVDDTETEAESDENVPENLDDSEEEQAGEEVEDSDAGSDVDMESEPDENISEVLGDSEEEESGEEVEDSDQGSDVGMEAEPEENVSEILGGSEEEEAGEGDNADSGSDVDMEAENVPENADDSQGDNAAEENEGEDSGLSDLEERVDLDILADGGFMADEEAAPNDAAEDDDPNAIRWRDIAPYPDDDTQSDLDYDADAAPKEKPYWVVDEINKKEWDLLVEVDKRTTKIATRALPTIIDLDTDLSFLDDWDSGDDDVVADQEKTDSEAEEEAKAEAESDTEWTDDMLIQPEKWLDERDEMLKPNKDYNTEDYDEYLQYNPKDPRCLSHPDPTLPKNPHDYIKITRGDLDEIENEDDDVCPWQYPVYAGMPIRKGPTVLSVLNWRQDDLIEIGSGYYEGKRPKLEYEANRRLKKPRREKQFEDLQALLPPHTLISARLQKLQLKIDRLSKSSKSKKGSKAEKELKTKKEAEEKAEKLQKQLRRLLIKGNRIFRSIKEEKKVQWPALELKELEFKLRLNLEKKLVLVEHARPRRWTLKPDYDQLVLRVMSKWFPQETSELKTTYRKHLELSNLEGEFAVRSERGIVLKPDAGLKIGEKGQLHYIPRLMADITDTNRKLREENDWLEKTKPAGPDSGYGSRGNSDDSDDDSNDAPPRSAPENVQANVGQPPEDQAGPSPRAENAAPGAASGNTGPQSVPPRVEQPATNQAQAGPAPNTTSGPAQDGSAPKKKYVKKTPPKEGQSPTHSTSGSPAGNVGLGGKKKRGRPVGRKNDKTLAKEAAEEAAGKAAKRASEGKGEVGSAVQMTAGNSVQTQAGPSGAGPSTSPPTGTSGAVQAGTSAQTSPGRQIDWGLGDILAGVSGLRPSGSPPGQNSVPPGTALNRPRAPPNAQERVQSIAQHMQAPQPESMQRRLMNSKPDRLAYHPELGRIMDGFSTPGPAIYRLPMNSHPYPGRQINHPQGMNDYNQASGNTTPSGGLPGYSQPRGMLPRNPALLLDATARSVEYRYSEQYPASLVPQTMGGENVQRPQGQFWDPVRENARQQTGQYNQSPRLDPFGVPYDFYTRREGIPGAQTTTVNVPQQQGQYTAGFTPPRGTPASALPVRENVPSAVGYSNVVHPTNSSPSAGPQNAGILPVRVGTENNVSPTAGHSNGTASPPTTQNPGNQSPRPRPTPIIPPEGFQFGGMRGGQLKRSDTQALQSKENDPSPQDEDTRRSRAPYPPEYQAPQWNAVNKPRPTTPHPKPAKRKRDETEPGAPARTPLPTKRPGKGNRSATQESCPDSKPVSKKKRRREEDEETPVKKTRPNKRPKVGGLPLSEPRILIGTQIPEGFKRHTAGESPTPSETSVRPVHRSTAASPEPEPKQTLRSPSPLSSVEDFSLSLEPPQLRSPSPLSRPGIVRSLLNSSTAQAQPRARRTKRIAAGRRPQKARGAR
jgi:hypothetical protein